MSIISTLTTAGHSIYAQGASISADVMAKDYDNGFNPKIEVNTQIPFYSALKDLVGGGFAIAYVVIVASLVLAGILWGVGKFAKHQGAQTAGISAICVILIVAIIVGSANGIVHWASKVNATKQEAAVVQIIDQPANMLTHQSSL